MHVRFESVEQAFVSELGNLNPAARIPGTGARKLKLVNWNVEWASPRSRRRAEILRRIEEHDPEVICLTETHDELLARDGYTISSQPDYGYPIKPHRRKVMLWSREPWEQVDDVGNDTMPPGRFVSGVTRTSLGEFTVVGICIPWFGSRTEARRKSEAKKRWEDHAQYLTGLTKVLGRMTARPLIVTGDFNQIIGKGNRAPPELRSALEEALCRDLAIVTSDLAFQGRKAIDHIALGDDLKCESLDVLSNIDGDRQLSDHFGVAADITARRTR